MLDAFINLVTVDGDIGTLTENLLWGGSILLLIGFFAFLAYKINKDDKENNGGR